MISDYLSVQFSIIARKQFHIFSCSDRHCGHGIFGCHGGNTGLLFDELFESVQEASAARKHDTAVGDISRKLRRSLLENAVDSLNDLRCGGSSSFIGLL